MVESDSPDPGQVTLVAGDPLRKWGADREEDPKTFDSTRSCSTRRAGEGVWEEKTGDEQGAWDVTAEWSARERVVQSTMLFDAVRKFAVEPEIAHDDADCGLRWRQRD